MLEDMTNENGRSRLRKEIDENLKRVYEEELDREVPDSFTQLLEQLKNKEKGK